MLCVIGPNGCGKTTLFNLITGHLRPTEGSIRFAGHDLTRLKPHQIGRLGIGRKFQVPSVFDDLSVADNLRVARFAEAGRAGLWGLRQRSKGDGDADLLARVGLADQARTPAGALSHGQKQWLEIALVLALEPRLILLDEPTAGMTRGETAATAELIKDIHRGGGVAVILIEHDMHFVAALDCPVAVMMRGAIVARGDYATVRAVDAVREGYLGAGHA
ncbi:MAG: ATP-binding cassette domain-containing protein [Rhodobacterales bacterium]|nr:ATP-binding cassette domain-containing protein [Rhodobacterales bacterium]